MITITFIIFFMIILYLGIVYYNTLPKKRTEAFRLYIKNEKLIPKGKMTFPKAYLLNPIFFIDYFF